MSQLVNEAAFAIGEGVGSPDDVDTGLEVGLSHPRGPVAWSEATGLEVADGYVLTCQALPTSPSVRVTYDY